MKESIYQVPFKVQYRDIDFLKIYSYLSKLTCTNTGLVVNVQNNRTESDKYTQIALNLLKIKPGSPEHQTR